MAHQLPELPYPKSGLSPVISEKTLNFHHGKHHAAYVAKLNAAVEGTPFDGMPVEELLRSMDQVPANKKAAIFNNAAQHFNHSFYWNCMSPTGGNEPEGELAAAIDTSFGSFERFKSEFTNACATHFGSGWGWLVKKADGALAVVGTHDADTPLVDGDTPVLTCDVWEHAYYLDHQNRRPDYIEGFWMLVNWEFAAKNFGG